MRAPFTDEHLIESPFPQRLRTLLDEARPILKLSALAIAELSAEGGRVAPSWRQWVPWSRAPAALSPEVFARLVQGPPIRVLERADLQSLGAPFDDCHAATALVLTVSPQLSAAPDALLIAVHGAQAPLDAALLSELKGCLERGLSHDRRRRLAETVFHAVEQASDPIELTDSDARLLYANTAWEHTFGYSAQTAVGQTVGRLFRDQVAPLHDAAFYQFTLAALADGHSWSGALACRAKDGSRVLCEPMVSPFAAEAQGFSGNFAVRRNLAQRAERDKALASAHREFRTVLAAVPDGVAVLRDGKIYFVNGALLNMVGRSEQSVIGMAYVDLVHPDDRAHFLEAHETSVARVRVLREDGAARFAEISIAGAVSFEGKSATILLSRDVTDHRLAEEQLARADRLSALGSLAVGVAHEINNPLAFVSLNLRYIQGTNLLQGPVLDALNEAIDGAKRIQQIVMELRSFSAPEAPGPTEPVDVAKAASSAINIAQNEIRHRAQLERRLEDGLFVQAREGQLVQVFVNLLVNAAHAIPLGDGRDHLIRVSSETLSPNAALIEISDTGTGMAPNVLAHVFDPFSTTKRRGEGSGLGLAISKRIIEQLGGRISIRSRVGKGTSVRIELARAPRESLVLDLAPGERSATQARKLRLLIVDDEVNLAQTLERVLPEQYDISLAYDAEQAVEVLSADGDFDVILCDLMMPGVPGLDLYRDVCHMRPAFAARFVFMTGGAFNERAREFMEQTRCPVLAKPFSIDTVCQVVEQLVEQNETRSGGTHATTALDDGMLVGGQRGQRPG
jgi:PAS domain S-box-containing protein